MMLSTKMDIALAVAIPALAFILNWGMRASQGYKLSAAADFVLAIAAFDLSALFARDLFIKAMHNITFQESFSQIFGLLFIGTTAIWCGLFIRLEGALEHNYKGTARKQKLTGRGQAIFFGSWALVMVIAAPHVFAFLYN